MVLTDPDSIIVQVVDPQVVKVDWYVDDKVVAVGAAGRFRPAEHIRAKGPFRIRAHVYDEVVKHAYSDRGGLRTGTPRSRPSDSLDWVRDNPVDLQQNLLWNIQLTKVPILGAHPPRPTGDAARSGRRAQGRQASRPWWKFTSEWYGADGRLDQSVPLR